MAERMYLTDDAEAKYLTEEYEEKIESFVESHPDLAISSETATDEFLSKCETFDSLFRDETALTVVRQQAFSQITWALTYGR